MRRETYLHYMNNPDPIDEQAEAWLLSMCTGLEDVE